MSILVKEPEVTLLIVLNPAGVILKTSGWLAIIELTSVSTLLDALEGSVDIRVK